MAALPVRRFYGVGPKTAERMASMDIHVGADLRAKDMDFMVENFGSSASYLYYAARGIDRRAVKSNRVRKSVGRERTYSEDLSDDRDLQEALDSIVDSVWQRIEDNSAQGRTVTLKVKYQDFRQITRSKSCDNIIEGKEQFGAIARELLDQVLPVTLGVRLLGLTLSGLGKGDSDTTDTPVTHRVAEQRSFEF